MVRFGDLTLDVATRELRRGAEVVHLEPLAFDLLAYLVTNRDRVVPKAELLEAVWGHAFMSEANLTTRIKEVRRALGDDGSSQHTIRNVRGRGYRFVARLDDGARQVDRAGLVGRDADAERVTAALRRSRLVTIVGPGGVGKTTLARAVARHHDAVIEVDLSSLSDDPSVLAALARSAGVVIDQEHPAATIAAIARLDALLVLDSCEHVAGAVASLVDALLHAPAGRVRALATSQVRLSLSAETVVQLAPLELEAAAELFVQRAGAARDTWAGDGVTTERIVRLVEVLDRLPLTVEMAAARLGSMTFDDLERFVVDESGLVQMSHRAPARRHQSLEALVEWSAAMLDAREIDVLGRLTAFPGVVTAEAAGRVLDGVEPAAVAFVLSALADRSLLAADLTGPSASYTMLTTVRAVAVRWLERSGKADAARRAHAAYAADLAEHLDLGLRGHDEAACAIAVDAMVDDARAAHRWALEHDVRLGDALLGGLSHWAYSRVWNEPAAWADALIAAAPSDELPGARVVRAGAAAHRGDLATARSDAGRASATPSPRLRAAAVEVLADVALYSGELDLACELAHELGQLAHELGDHHVGAFAVVDEALARAWSGQIDDALRVVDAARWTECSPSDRAWLHYARGDVLSAARDHDALEEYQQALALGSSVGAYFIVSVARSSIADEHARHGDVDQALVAFRDALADAHRRGNVTHGVTAMRSLAALWAMTGHDEEAAVLLGATTAHGTRASFGAEAERAGRVLTELTARVGEHRIDRWIARGRALGPVAALPWAIGVLDAHDPHAILRPSSSEGVAGRGPLHP